MKSLSLQKCRCGDFYLISPIMYQIIERLMMKSPFLMGLIALGVIFLYLKFVISLFNDWEHATKKERRNRLIFIILSPLGLWFLISINSSSLETLNNDSNSKKESEIKKEKLRTHFDSIIRNNHKTYEENLKRQLDSINN